MEALLLVTVLAEVLDAGELNRFGLLEIGLEVQLRIIFVAIFVGAKKGKLFFVVVVIDVHD